MMPRPCCACRCADAVANFLAEAVGGAARRPHELWEAQQVALSSAPGGSTPPHSGEIGFSLLGVAALRQALKVARSAKMPAHARAAVCGYVAGAHPVTGFSKVCGLGFSVGGRVSNPAACCLPATALLSLFVSDLLDRKYRRGPVMTSRCHNKL